ISERNTKRRRDTRGRQITDNYVVTLSKNRSRSPMRKQLAPVPYPTTREQATTGHVRKRPRPRQFNLSSLGAMTFLFVFAMYFLVPFFWLVVSSNNPGLDL